MKYSYGAPPNQNIFVLGENEKLIFTRGASFNQGVAYLQTPYSSYKACGNRNELVTLIDIPGEVARKLHSTDGTIEISADDKGNVKAKFLDGSDDRRYGYEGDGSARSGGRRGRRGVNREREDLSPYDKWLEGLKDHIGSLGFSEMWSAILAAGMKYGLQVREKIVKHLGEDKIQMLIEHVLGETRFEHALTGRFRHALCQKMSREFSDDDEQLYGLLVDNQTKTNINNGMQDSLQNTLNILDGGGAAYDSTARNNAAPLAIPALGGVLGNMRPTHASPLQDAYVAFFAHQLASGKGKNPFNRFYGIAWNHPHRIQNLFRRLIPGLAPLPLGPNTPAPDIINAFMGATACPNIAAGAATRGVRGSFPSDGRRPRKPTKDQRDAITIDQFINPHAPEIEWGRNIGPMIGGVPAHARIVPRDPTGQRRNINNPKDLKKLEAALDRLMKSIEKPALSAALGVPAITQAKILGEEARNHIDLLSDNFLAGTHRYMPKFIGGLNVSHAGCLIKATAVNTDGALRPEHKHLIRSMPNYATKERLVSHLGANNPALGVDGLKEILAQHDVDRLEEIRQNADGTKIFQAMLTTPHNNTIKPGPHELSRETRRALKPPTNVQPGQGTLRSQRRAGLQRS